MDMAATEPLLIQLLENIQQQVNRLERKQDEQTATLNKTLLQVQKTNGRVTQSEKDIKSLQSVKGRKLNLSPQTIYILALVALVVVIVVAGLLGFDVRGLIT